MPIYEYICKNCKNEFEEQRSIKSLKRKKCPKCGKLKLEIKIKNVSIIFKGSGWTPKYS